MERQSRLSLGVVLKNFTRVAPHPWISKRLVALEGEKHLFNLLYPRAQEGRGRKIRVVSFRPTDLCNLRCKTCGQWGGQGYQLGKKIQQLKADEVPLSRYLFLLEDLVRHGHHPILNIWGGEPMLYKGTVELVEAAARLGLPALIVSNGTTGIVSAADRLVKAPLFSLQISIDGHCAELQNELRPGVGGKNSFARIEASLAAIRQARESRGRRLPLISVNTVISRRNFRHLVDIYETFRDRVDAFFFFLSWWIDEAGARAHEQDFSRRFGFRPRSHWGWVGDWKPEDYHAVDQQLREIIGRSQSLSAPSVSIHPAITGSDNLRTYYTDHEELFGYKRCLAVFQEVAVNSNGDVSPCRDYTDYVVGNVKHATITELWNSPAFLKFRRSLATEGLMPVCSRCCGLMAY